MSGGMFCDISTPFTGCIGSVRSLIFLNVLVGVISMLFPGVYIIIAPKFINVDGDMVSTPTIDENFSPKNYTYGSLTAPITLNDIFHSSDPASPSYGNSTRQTTIPILISAFVSLAVFREIFAVFFFLSAIMHCSHSWSNGSCEPSNSRQDAEGFAIEKISSIFIWTIFYSCVAQICVNLLFLLFNKLGYFCNNGLVSSCGTGSNIAALIALTMNEVELLLLVILQRLWRQSTFNVVHSRSLNTVSFESPQQRINLRAFT